MIILTGAAGFIGSIVAGYLNRQGYKDLVLVDDFSRKEKEGNYKNKEYLFLVERSQLLQWLQGKEEVVQAIIHLGARTDTMDLEEEIFQRLNLEYSQKLWNVAVSYQIPFIYASSAATYGAGEFGFSDDETLIPRLSPLNPYAKSKQEFDKWVLEQVAKERAPFFWAGLKFFNVYGPNEYHKGRMASVVFHGFHQIRNSGKIKLFKSYKSEFPDGEQKRDFIYVMDVAKVITHLMEQRPTSGIYNLGSGLARSFNDLANALFNALGLKPNIEYIEMPEQLKERYQYFTEAPMHKLREQGKYTEPFTSLEEGIKDYVQNYLLKDKYY